MYGKQIDTIIDIINLDPECSKKIRGTSDTETKTHLSVSRHTSVTMI